MKNELAKSCNNEIEQVLKEGGVKEKKLVRELWKIAKHKVDKVNTSDKLNAIEIILKMKGWLKDKDVEQHGALINFLLKGEDELKKMVIESEEVEKELGMVNE